MLGCCSLCSSSSGSFWIGMGRWRNLPAESPALAATFSCENLMRISQTDFFLLSRILPRANIFMVEVVGGRKILEQVPPPPPPFQSTLSLLVVLTLLSEPLGAALPVDCVLRILELSPDDDDASYLLITSLALVKTSAEAGWRWIVSRDTASYNTAAHTHNSGTTQ